MSSEYQLSLNDYISILRRRAGLLAATFAGIFTLAVAIALLVPPVYQSTGTIMVESQQISADLVQSAVTTYAEERIEVIRQRVMTRENLLRIIDKYGLFKDSRTSYTPSELIDEMRASIVIELLNVNANMPSRPKGNATIAFKLSFEHRDPVLAHRAANELVTLFLDENVKVRTERAVQTTEFLTQEADKLKIDLENLESQIATYKQEHGNVLPENMSVSMNAMQRIESELREVERDYKSAQEELRFLDVELSSAKAGIGAGQGTGVALSPAQELDRARSEYARLTSTYTENHPDVRAVKRKIEQLESKAGASEGSGVRTTGDLMVAKVEAKMASAKSRVASLGQQQGALRQRLNTLEKDIIKAPQVERGLTTLMRDHQNAQKKYEEIRAKQMTAQVSENLEGDKKAERFSMLEPPVLPDKPIKPNRKKMIALGFFLAIAGAAGLAMVLESMYGGVRGVEALEAIINRRPMAIIPYISLDAEERKRKALIKKILIGLAVAVVASLVAVHFLYLPLDILLMKILARLS